MALMELSHIRVWWEDKAVFKPVRSVWPIAESNPVGHSRSCPPFRKRVIQSRFDSVLDSLICLDDSSCDAVAP